LKCGELDVIEGAELIVMFAKRSLISQKDCIIASLAGMMNVQSALDIIVSNSKKNKQRS